MDAGSDPTPVADKPVRLYLPAEALAVIQLDPETRRDRRAIDHSVTERAASVILRYAAIVREHMPALAADEWLELCRVLRGVWRHPVGDHDHANSIEGDTTPALAVKLTAFSYAERVAIVDVVTRYWSLPEPVREDVSRALYAAGARVINCPS